ncbi:hypothetical protein GCM10011496_04130 [Polaromonas eurypsychrophila]|uniref:Uncharacterized protein n=1 Tax=Polaromonas eurypsychrophila TaxID=1614635 RepID=A0A916S6B6_9BURK|nr:hypothetical protein GCM10011496_04130 [Polaromonas eurypsychrophila]
MNCELELAPWREPPPPDRPTLRGFADAQANWDWLISHLDSMLKRLMHAQKHLALQALTEFG